jgi:hypothetical protein
MKKDRAKYRQMVDLWWQHWRTRPELYSSIRGLRQVLAIALTSKVVLPLPVPAGWVYSHAVGIFVYADDGHLALLSSAFHYWWAITYASTMRTDLRYTPSDVFETFPQPEMTPRLDAAGDRLDLFRRPLMLDRQLGLTALYNLVHDPITRDRAIQRLREIHIETDLATAEAYGWSELPLDHGFHPTRQGVRFTVSEAARTELLDRLLELNHARHADEAANGTNRLRGSRSRKKSTSATEQRLLDAIIGQK